MNQTSSNSSILVAAAPRSLEPIVSALGTEYRLTLTGNLSQAKPVLNNRFDLIVCGLHFDESRMFDLLRHVKAEETTRTIPFIAVKATEGELSRTLLQGIEIACAALGADKFVELTEWERRYGMPAAHQRFRMLAARMMAG